MQKPIIILLLLSAVACAPKKYLTESLPSSGEESIERIIENVYRNNISEESFQIEKGSLAVNINNTSNKYLFSVRFNKPDIYLISIRNSTGMEGARIFITKDTVLINDRIGKRILYGKPKELEKYSGFPYYMINAIFGDLVLKEVRSKGDALSFFNSVIITQAYYGKAWKSILDPGKGKVISTSVINSNGQDELTFIYSKFSRAEKHMPLLIEMIDKKNNVNAKIRVEKFRTGSDQEILFVPGKGYSKEEIR